MRNFPRNSPQAAARVVALALLADGDVDDTELAAMARIDVAGRLDLAPVELMAIVQSVGHELLTRGDGTWLRNPCWSEHTPFTGPQGALILVKTGHLSA